MLVMAAVAVVLNDTREVVKRATLNVKHFSAVHSSDLTVSFSYRLQSESLVCAEIV